MSFGYVQLIYSQICQAKLKLCAWETLWCTQDFTKLCIYGCLQLLLDNHNNRKTIPLLGNDT